MVVGGLLVLLMLQFTKSRLLAVGIVAFMVIYMSLMTWWGSKNIERHRQ